MSPRSYTFSHAIVRPPGKSCVSGLRAIDSGAPDIEQFQKDHYTYVNALKSTGASITELPASESYPDSVFVEDTALCLNEVVIIMQPGAPSRAGETQLIEPALTTLYENVLQINGQGSIEGGDILATENEILVGLSARTNSEGVHELERHLSNWDYKVRVVNTPPNILHFKTDCSLLDEETILATPELASTGCFDGYRVIHTAEGENACANAIRFNNLVIMPDGYPRTEDKLISLGYQVVPIGNKEAAKLDGGMSCMSLRFTPS